MKQKPIAWMDDLEFYTPEDYEYFVKNNLHKNLTPLYKNLRNLTNKEIQEVINRPEFEKVFELEDFAKAIIRKAQDV